jgi:hypothetical protein
MAILAMNNTGRMPEARRVLGPAVPGLTLATARVPTALLFHEPKTLTQIEEAIDLQPAINVQYNPGAIQGAEPPLRSRNGIFSRNQVGDHVLAPLIAGGFKLDTGSHVLNRNGDIGDYGLRWIAHGSCYRPAFDLGTDGAHGDQNGHGKANHNTMWMHGPPPFF